ncbi:MAG TPA: M24 family metallopeptidase, partial [Methylomirabilota bacterium]|nr:M24 family metallopeptidase [Methylomirabilota bacterium]
SAIGTVARSVAMDAGADYVVRDRVQSGPEKMKGIRWPFASLRKVRKGELVSIDFVGWVNSYGFDILRTGCVGRPNRQQRMLIELADEATHAMSNALTDNADVKDSVDALNQFDRPGISISPFGHSIGLEIVEKPYLFPGATGTIKKNMVFCVEPDVRSSRDSACVEDELIVTAGKPRTLTKLPVDFWK